MKKKMNNCLLNCNYLKKIDDEFHCSLYNEYLLFDKILSVTDDQKFKIFKCKHCIYDSINDSNKDKLLELKKMIGWISDEFYSFKDEFEETINKSLNIINDELLKNEEEID